MEDPGIQKALREKGFDGYNSNELNQPFFVYEPGKTGSIYFNPEKQKHIDLYNRERYFDKQMNPETPDPVKNTAIFNPANIRSKFAKFNPKYAGIGAGSVMSADLLADENGLLSSPDRNSILGYMADSYKYMADEGGLLGNILYSGGGKALNDLSYGTTPMKKGSGRLPSTPTNESLLNLMELFQL